MLDGFVAADDFKSVFAGVAGARDQKAAVIFKFESADLIFLQIGHGINPRRRDGGAGNDSR